MHQWETLSKGQNNSAEERNSKWQKFSIFNEQESGTASEVLSIYCSNKRAHNKTDFQKNC
jgi:hypothetical protein